ncbi:MAG: mannitol dehydrogenase family protein [Pseudomonadota bacterium]|nr:mannitol dehydrogenase family protein [Pseudomonadota bacterium]
MDELVRLGQSNLERLPAGVRRPRYDRAALSPGIVHVGLGNFHRAHQAWYLHRLFEAGLNLDWAIVGAGVRPGDAVQRQKLLGQDCLTTLIELDPSGTSAEVVGSMIDFVPVEATNAALIARMAQPDIRIVSLTVTEGGYYIDPDGGGLDSSHPDIVHDAANPQAPVTVFGAVVAALKRRRALGLGPFAGQCCDNLKENGAILRRTIVSLAAMSDPELAAWIGENCSFPNSMVDCIVPATGPGEIALAREFGIDDKVPVTHENFRQWVMEDDFCAGRPDWDRVGATFTGRVQDYEAMKLRILNGGHQVIALPGELLGIRTIAGAMAEPLIARLLRRVVTEEIAPHVAPVPGMTPLGYLDLVERRFSNTRIEDTTRRVAFDGSSRQPGFVMPSIRDGLRAGTPVEGLALVSAMWAVYCRGRREDGAPIEPNDPAWTVLSTTALEARDSPMAWLGMRRYYGDLADAAPFANSFVRWMEHIGHDGVAGTISAYLAS